MADKNKHGNNAKVDPKNKIVPMYLTNTITPKKEQTSNEPVNSIPQNAIFAKEYVDENHK